MLTELELVFRDDRVSMTVEPGAGIQVAVFRRNLDHGGPVAVTRGSGARHRTADEAGPRPTRAGPPRLDPLRRAPAEQRGRAMGRVTRKPRSAGSARYTIEARGDWISADLRRVRREAPGSWSPWTASAGRPPSEKRSSPDRVLEAEVLPERRAPAIVVSAGEQDRQPARQLGKPGYGTEAGAGDRPAIREPEAEQVAVDEQPVAQSRHPVQEPKQRVLHLGGYRPKVGIAQHHQTMNRPGHGLENT